MKDRRVVMPVGDGGVVADDVRRGVDGGERGRHGPGAMGGGRVCGSARPLALGMVDQRGGVRRRRGWGQ
jgi:hypothetical protein